MKAIGWGMLAERPDREIVMGAVTKPWEPNPVFRALPPDAFAAFAEPDNVKIAWTVAVAPTPDGGSLFRTETRAVAIGAGGAQEVPPLLVASCRPASSSSGRSWCARSRPPPSACGASRATTSSPTRARS